MNRADRRRLSKLSRGHFCTHGHPKKTGGDGKPICPYGCGFPLQARQGMVTHAELVQAQREGRTDSTA